jgi:hypothetical protein
VFFGFIGRKVVMEGARCWSVEAKVFEVLIKGGGSGVRIYESSKNKKSFIFVRREELAWLVGALEEVAESDKSEIFWDQSRAGFPRVLMQKRSNRHGRFLSVEEFDGRRRCGSILIPEGPYGQGSARLMVELDGANSLLWEGRKSRERKKGSGEPVRQRQSELLEPLNLLEKVRSDGNGVSLKVSPKIMLSKSATNEIDIGEMTSSKTQGQVGRALVFEQPGEAVCGGVGMAGLLSGAKPKDRWLQALITPAP